MKQKYYLISGIIIILVVVGIILTNYFSQTDNRNIYEEICPWNDADTCKYGIENIVPLCDEISEVQEWKEKNPAATLEHAYTLRKMTPEEVNDWFLGYKSYQDIFGTNKTNKVWWAVDYAWGEIKKCDNPPCAVIPEHPRFTVYVEEENKSCKAFKRFQ